jgi:hypothetical protein
MSYHVGRDVRAYCFDCGGTDRPKWDGKNAHGVAARHAQKTGHEVHVEVYMNVVYNKREEKKVGV